MKDCTYNYLMLVGILLATALIILCVVTGINAGGPVIFQGICSLIGGIIGAGGAALAVYLTLYWHTADVRGQTISGLYVRNRGLSELCRDIPYAIQTRPRRRRTCQRIYDNRQRRRVGLEHRAGVCIEPLSHG
jgi:hypothetical protein